MSRFDPHADKDYAACTNCDETFPTRTEMSEHLSATFKNGKSHSARITNPSRLERIESALENCADDAAYEFVSNAERLLDDGVTEDEIAEAVRSIHTDFATAWEQNR